MPHQCLSCGFAFQEGSSALLKGCPQCKGTRFFYSAAEVDADERQRIADDAQRDLRQVVTQMLSEASPEARKTLEDKAGADGWAQLRPRDLRKLVKQVQADAKANGAQGDAKANGALAGANGAAGESAEPAPDATRLAAMQAAKQRIEKELVEREAKPDTVTVGDGEYEIDIKGLLEKNPIVVQKDGAYLIHLPSLFGEK